MKRPPRSYLPPRLNCAKCGEPIKVGRYSGWEHVRRVSVTDPSWHVAVAS